MTDISITLRGRQMCLSSGPGCFSKLYIEFSSEQSDRQFGIHIFPNKSPVVRRWGYEHPRGSAKTFGIGPLALFVWI